jgi:hypothetical protein
MKIEKILETYWSDSYKGPPIASDELGRLAAKKIRKLKRQLNDTKSTSTTN